jgi:hypothetical protein
MMHDVAYEFLRNKPPAKTGGISLSTYYPLITGIVANLKASPTKKKRKIQKRVADQAIGYSSVQDPHHTVVDISKCIDLEVVKHFIGKGLRAVPNR